QGVGQGRQFRRSPAPTATEGAGGFEPAGISGVTEGDATGHRDRAEVPATAAVPGARLALPAKAVCGGGQIALLVVEGSAAGTFNEQAGPLKGIPALGKVGPCFSGTRSTGRTVLPRRAARGPRLSPRNSRSLVIDAAVWIGSRRGRLPGCAAAGDG